MLTDYFLKRKQPICLEPNSLLFCNLTPEEIIFSDGIMPEVKRKSKIKKMKKSYSLLWKVK